MLWDRGTPIDRKILEFTVGNDHILDYRLIPYDVKASLAHVRMLNERGIISEEDADSLTVGLEEVRRLYETEEFPVSREQEDCHTAIEDYLTKRFGERGKKVHTARSRNDQVLTALRLYEKDVLASMRGLLLELKKELETAARKNSDIPLPGYTHMRKAMPTSIDVWLDSFITALEDDLAIADTVGSLVDRSPLGTAAGFGVPVFEIDREMTAREMGFSSTIENPMYAQLSRGKIEGLILHGCTHIMLDLNRLASDLILFSMPEFGYIRLPEKFCTGSSVMPQKKNPDVLELIRAKFHEVAAEEHKVLAIPSDLISGYNRDLQLTKGPLFCALDTTMASVSIISNVIAGIEIDEHGCRNAMTEELYATEEAYKLVRKGVSFRDAYRQIARRYRSSERGGDSSLS
jgi:argininosuccinate lyase